MKTLRWFHRPSSILPQLRILIAGTLFVLAAAMLANAFQKGPTAITPSTPSPAPDYPTQLGPTKGPGQVPPPSTGPGDFYPGDTLSDRSFYVHDLGHRCLDFGGPEWWVLGAPVFIYSCNGTVAQQVRVKEIDISHDVELRVESFLPKRSFCIGVRGGRGGVITFNFLSSIGAIVSGGRVVVGQPLELQHCNDSPAQRFALDGDAILMGSQASGRVTREFTIEPQNDFTPSRTPLVVGSREASDAEYFRFEAVDRSEARPTSGFVRVASETWLNWALTLGWGTVIEIDDRQPLVLEGPFPKEIREGATVRGYRKYTHQGPEVRTCVRAASSSRSACDNPDDPNSLPSSPFCIAEDHVRFTGLRLRGPMDDPRCPDGQNLGPPPESQGIRIRPGEQMRIWIDHLDVSRWNGSAIDVRAERSLRFCEARCPDPPLEGNRNEAVRVVGNFIHHNEVYGVVTGSGGFILVRGNVMYNQRAHSVTCDGAPLSGYVALDNLALRTPTESEDFDIHGSCKIGSHSWLGGVSGDFFDIASNTFLASNHLNVNQRGTPCRSTRIHHNVFVQSEQGAINTMSEDLSKHVSFANTFSARPDPLSDLAVVDFDGDGVEDVFVGTGAAWYFSSGGQAEWRYLNRMPEHARELLFGDFDRDGRADVIGLHGGRVDVSWGGLSPWQTINVTAWKISDLAVGDFDGDRHADLFLATGTEWFFAPGGRNWTPFHRSRYRTRELRFGDFQHTGRTQVLRVSKRKWEIAALGLSWTPIGSVPAASFTTPPIPPTRSVLGLIVADFDGDGFDDVARTNSLSPRWEYTSPGRTVHWAPLRTDSSSLGDHPVGRFDGDRTADVILWNDTGFDYAASGRNPLKPLSRQHMR